MFIFVYSCWCFLLSLYSNCLFLFIFHSHFLFAAPCVLLAVLVFIFVHYPPSWNNNNHLYHFRNFSGMKIKMLVLSNEKGGMVTHTHNKRQLGKWRRMFLFALCLNHLRNKLSCFDEYWSHSEMDKTTNPNQKFHQNQSSYVPDNCDAVTVDRRRSSGYIL